MKHSMKDSEGETEEQTWRAMGQFNEFSEMVKEAVNSDH